MFKHQGAVTVSNSCPPGPWSPNRLQKKETSKRKIKIQYMIGRDELFHRERLSTYPEASGDNVADDQSIQRAGATLSNLTHS